MGSLSQLGTSAAVVVSTVVTSALLVLIFQKLGGAGIGRAADHLPLEWHNIANVLGTKVLVPLLLVVVFSLIKDVAAMGVAVPMMMNSIDVLEDIKGKTTQDNEKLQWGLNAIRNARKTVFRTSLFVVVAVLVTIGTIGFSYKTVVATFMELLNTLKAKAADAIVSHSF